MPPADTLPELDDAAYQRALAILLDVGTSIAKELKTPSDTVSVRDRARAFDVVALAVRRTIILSKHVTEHPTVPPAAEDPITQRTRQRKEVIRVVGEAIEHRASPADAPALRVELLERMDSLELERDLAHQSPAQVIEGLCRDLGVAELQALRRYPRRTPCDIALLCAQAAAPAGSGLPQAFPSAAVSSDPALKAAPHSGSPLHERRHL